MIRPNTTGLLLEGNPKEEKARRRKLMEKLIMGSNFSKQDYEEKEVPRGILPDLSKKLQPLVEAKQQIDSAYSQGYFENHFPEADSKLKELAHQKVLSALDHARSLVSAPAESEKSININIKLGQ